MFLFYSWLVMENSPVQAENSNTDTNDQTDAVADVIQLKMRFCCRKGIWFSLQSNLFLPMS